MSVARENLLKSQTFALFLHVHAHFASCGKGREHQTISMTQIKERPLFKIRLPVRVQVPLLIFAVGKSGLQEGAHQKAAGKKFLSAL